MNASAGDEHAQGGQGVGYAGHDKQEHAGIPPVVAIGRHPVHPMLVPLPIGLFAAALVGDVGYWTTGNTDWANVTVWLLGAGLIAGIAAATAGLEDYLGRPRIRALTHARDHLIGNVAVLAIAAISLTLRLTIGAVEAVLPWGLGASIVIAGLLVFTAWHGGEMVFGHGVGMVPHAHGEHQAAQAKARR